ncbi:MAG: CHASE2 domain-containing protein, partial [Chloroflexi bacterium]
MRLPRLQYNLNVDHLYSPARHPMLTSWQRFRRRTTHLLFIPRHPWRRLRGGLIIGLVVGSLLALALRTDLLSGIRLQLTDYLYTEDSLPTACRAICLRVQNSYTPDNPHPTQGITAIVAIDDRSLGALGRTPVEWSRGVHADLVRVLTDSGARVIAFDLLFADPSEDDAVLAEAMLAAGNVVQPVAGGWESSRQTTTRGEFIRFDTYTYPTAELREAAQVIGHVNIVPDEDGKVREVPLVIRDGDQYIPAMALAAYLQYLHYPVELLEIEQHHVKFANRDLYTDDIGQMMISFFGDPTNVNQRGTFPVYSYVDVLEGHVPPEAFKDKIVLVGVLDAQGNPDSYATPSTRTGKKMYGVEIIASIIETIHQSLPTVPLIHD